MRQKRAFLIYFVRFICETHQYSYQGLITLSVFMVFSSWYLLPMPQSSCLSLTYVVPDSAHDPQDGAIALVLTAPCLQDTVCTVLLPFWTRKSGPWCRETAFSLGGERLLGGCCQWCSTSSEFLYVIPIRVSWRLCLYWCGVDTSHFQLWDLLSFLKDAALLPW